METASILEAYQRSTELPALAAQPLAPVGPESWPHRPERTGRVRPRYLTWKGPVLGGLVVGGLGSGVSYGVSLWHYYQIHVSTDNATVVGHVLPISAQVSGPVAAVLVENGQHVTAGQAVVQLEPQHFAARVSQTEEAVTIATARVQQAVADVRFLEEQTRNETTRASAAVREAQSGVDEVQQQVHNAQTQIQVREAAVAAAATQGQQARLEVAVQACQRLHGLSADGIVPRQQLDEAAGVVRVRRAEMQGGESQLRQAQSELARAQREWQGRRKEVDKARARVEIMQAQSTGVAALLKQAQVEREQARKQLADTTVRAPVAGMIARTRVEPGQGIKDGQPLLALVPLEQVWVEAHFKETQLGVMRPGHAATLHIDAYPGEVFHGVVDSLSPGTGSIFSLLPPENATGNSIKVVQRVTVRITVDPASLHGLVLRPGMSVIATVQTL